MPLNADHVPRFSVSEAEHLALELYGVAATPPPRELPSERDQNFYLEDPSESGFVLKIAGAGEQRDMLDAQNRAMDYVGNRGRDVPCPRVRTTLSGESISATTSQMGTEHFVRLVTWIPGITLADAAPHSSDLLGSLGGFLGRLDHALEGFAHPAARRVFYWDLRYAADTIAKCIDHVVGAEQRRVIEEFSARFGQNVVPQLPHLRTSVIHNDANDHNVVISEDASAVIGIIDFGDMVESCTVFDLAVGVAYAILDEPNPIEAATYVVAGYNEVFPLNDTEIELLYDLISMRLCLSVSISAYQQTQNPKNDYLTISEQSAWTTLDKLNHTDPALAINMFSDSCKTQR